MSMWTFYKVRLDFVTQLCASVPADPEIAKKWIEARQPAVRPPGGRSINEIQEEVFATLALGEEQAPPSLLIFQRHQGVLSMRAATFRAHIKDCARVLSNQWIGTIEGERSFSTRVINGVYEDARQYWVPILRPDGTPVTTPDGTRDKAIHPKPNVSAIKTFEFVDPARIDFTVKVLTAVPGAGKGKGEKRKALPAVTLEDLSRVLEYGGTHGYAGERGDGEGRYTFEIEEMK
jgi:hypothetical protein